MACYSYHSDSQRGEFRPPALNRQIPHDYHDPDFLQEYQSEIDEQDPSQQASTTPEQRSSFNAEHILPTARSNRDSSMSTFSYVNNDQGALSRVIGHTLQNNNPDCSISGDYRVSRPFPSLPTRAEAEIYYADPNRDVMYNLNHLDSEWYHHEPIILYPSPTPTTYVPRGIPEVVGERTRNRFELHACLHLRELPTRLYLRELPFHPHLRAMVQSARSGKTHVKQAFANSSKFASAMSQQLRRRSLHR